MLFRSIDESHLISTGTAKCLKGPLTSGVEITNWDDETMRTRSLQNVRVLIAEGTFKNTDFDPLYVQYREKMNFPKLVDGKFRALWRFDQFQKKWFFSAMVTRAVSVTGWGDNDIVSRSIQQIQMQ